MHQTPNPSSLLSNRHRIQNLVFNSGVTERRFLPSDIRTCEGKNLPVFPPTPPFSPPPTIERPPLLGGDAVRPPPMSLCRPRQGAFAIPLTTPRHLRNSVAFRHGQAEKEPVQLRSVGKRPAE